MSIVEKAEIIAYTAHKAVNQKRKYSGIDYINHPEEVVNILDEYGHFAPEVIAAAWLHDVVEDTAVTVEDIQKIMGVNVAALVFWLTDPKSTDNRATRKAATIERYTRAPADAHNIKCADLMANAKDIRDPDPKFWAQFQKEAIALMYVLDKAKPELWQATMREIMK